MDSRLRRNDGGAGMAGWDESYEYEMERCVGAEVTEYDCSPSVVILANAGIHFDWSRRWCGVNRKSEWIPAFAGMTVGAGMAGLGREL
ncbi:hypothetical protein DT594_17750 [Halopseudomonas laoshanensis]|uniref:Uncharacterized protein n=1 Tax=Halopseudomonas laoshanensis TaxID=2268758 RepID=A0A7V7GN79_9GAMM|nr:hypothetical protein DT594_17750 [Halopseudomonas laoshanensis]